MDNKSGVALVVALALAFISYGFGSAGAESNSVGMQFWYCGASLISGGIAAFLLFGVAGAFLYSIDNYRQWH